MDKKRNRAKCKLCGDILESFHMDDYVKCSCNEISICGGQDRYFCAANDWKNFVRVDDDDSEIIPMIVDKESMSRKHVKLDMLRNMVETFKNLPDHERYKAITGQDFYSSLSLLLELFES